MGITCPYDLRCAEFGCQSGNAELSGVWVTTGGIGCRCRKERKIFARVKDIFRRSEEKASATCPSYRLVMVAVELTNEDEGDEREDDDEEKESCCCFCCER